MRGKDGGKTKEGRTEDEGAVGEEAQVFGAGLVAGLPAGDDAAAEGTLDVVGHAQVEEAGGGQPRHRHDRRRREIGAEGPRPHLLAPQHLPLARRQRRTARLRLHRHAHLLLRFSPGAFLPNNNDDDDDDDKKGTIKEPNSSFHRSTTFRSLRERNRVVFSFYLKLIGFLVCF